jgi:hypothetical protein
MPEVSVIDTIIFSDEVVSTTKIGTLQEVINFVETLDSHQYFELMADTVQLNDEVEISAGVTYNCTLSDDMILDDEVWPHYEQVEDYLFLYDWLEIPTGYLPETLVLTDEITGWAGPSLSDTVTLEDSLSLTIVSALISEDSVSLVDAFTGWIPDPWLPVVPIPEERT